MVMATNDCELLARLIEINQELAHYAYGKMPNGERYAQWDEIALAFGAIERALERCNLKIKENGNECRGSTEDTKRCNR